MPNFNNTIFGQKAFIIDTEKKLLVLKRSNSKVYNEYWDVPGGKLEQTDTLLSGITREIKEETGLKLKRILAILTTTKFMGISKDKPIGFRNIYLCETSGKVVLSEEHSEYKWVSVKEIDKKQFPPDKDFQQALQLLSVIDYGILKPLSQLV